MLLGGLVADVQHRGLFQVVHPPVIQPPSLRDRRQVSRLQQTVSQDQKDQVVLRDLETCRRSLKDGGCSSATAAMARARSSLNCRRSALRLVVISSEVSSKWRAENLCFRTNGYPAVDFEKDRRLTFSFILPDIYLPC